MADTYVLHRIMAAPRQWQGVAESLRSQQTMLQASGGRLYGVWRSQIGRPRDEVTAITVWSGPIAAAQAQDALLTGLPVSLAASSQCMLPTLRPADAAPPERQGNYAFRWFVTPRADWPEFLELCAQAWPGFEAAYDSQVVGLWKCTGDIAGNLPDEAVAATPVGSVRSLLLTRRPSLAMWERSKLPQGAAETAVRDTLSRRYDLCSWTAVHTTTLLSATDSADSARWA